MCGPAWHFKLAKLTGRVPPCFAWGYRNGGLRFPWSLLLPCITAQSRSRNSIRFLIVPFNSVASFSAFCACTTKEKLKLWASPTFNREGSPHFFRQADMSVEHSIQYHNVRNPSPVLHGQCLKPRKTESPFWESYYSLQKLLESEHHSKWNTAYPLDFSRSDPHHMRWQFLPLQILHTTTQPTRLNQ